MSGGLSGNLAGSEYLGCSSGTRADHRTVYKNGAEFSRSTDNAATIEGAGDLGPLWVSAKSGFSENMDLYYNVKKAPGIWLCGTNYYPTSAGVIHAQNRT